MTQSTTNNPWAAASAYTPPVTSPTGGQQGGEGGSSALDGAYSTEPAESDLLFGARGPAAPSLFNKTHLFGTERSGIITKAPFDQQDTDYNGGGLKFWNDGKEPDAEGKVRATTTNPINRLTGKPNSPVRSVHVELATDYRLTVNEWVASGKEMRNPADFQEGKDDGVRIFVASAQGVNALREAIGRAKVRSGAELVGMRLTAKRAGQKANPGGNPSWVYEITLTRP